MIKRTSCQGFNLFELLIALLVLSILFFLSLPTLRDLVVKNKVLARVNHIVTALQFTRNTAITHGEVITFCKSADHKQCDGNWNNGQIVLGQNKQVLRIIDAVTSGDNLTWQASFGKNDALEFLPSGQTSGVQGSFYYCPKGAPQYARAIVINLQGRIYVSDKTASGKDIPCG